MAKLATLESLEALEAALDAAAANLGLTPEEFLARALAWVEAKPFFLGVNP